ncbi:MAG: glycine betaine ABC transporter substrate-binding protein, partial [Hyphomicrobiaceae bacterium]
MPNQQALWDKFIKEAKTVDHNTPYKGTQGMFVPHYLADKIKSFNDLKKPEIAAMFDKDGDGKGEYWAGDASWKSTKMWQVKFKDYGLNELWEPEIVSDATFKAQLKASYATEKPILFYYWTPEWIHAAYKISTLDEPARTEGCMALKLDQEDWLDASKFKCKHADASIYVAFSKSLEKRNPKAAKFLKQIKLDPAVVNGWILQIGRDKLDPQDVAESWVKENKATVDKWIN